MFVISAKHNINTKIHSIITYGWNVEKRKVSFVLFVRTLVFIDPPFNATKYSTDNIKKFHLIVTCASLVMDVINHFKDINLFAKDLNRKTNSFSQIATTKNK